MDTDSADSVLSESILPREVFVVDVLRVPFLQT